MDDVRWSLTDRSSPRLVHIFGHGWTRPILDDVSIGIDRQWIDARGLGRQAVIVELCTILGIKDLLMPIDLPHPILIFLLGLTPGHDDWSVLFRSARMARGLRLVLVTREHWPFLREESNCSFVHEVDISLSAIDLYEEMLEEFDPDLVKYVLGAIDRFDRVEIRHALRVLQPVYERLCKERGPEQAGVLLLPYFGLVHANMYSHVIGLDELDDLVDVTNAASVDPRRVNDFVRSLSRNQRVILVASFLASYNPIGMDKMLFNHERAKKGGRKQSEKSSSSLLASQLSLGPCPFDLNRMLAIALSLAPDDPLTGNIYSSISSLVNIGFLKFMSTSAKRGDFVQTARLICRIDIDLTRRLAESVRIRLGDYLYTGPRQ